MANDSRNRMRFDEADARRLLLARAIETTSTQGGLLTVAEGEDLDLRAVKMARAAAGPRGEIDVGRALVDRAKLVLQEIESRNASLAALQRMRVWHSSVFQFAALACFLMGLATDLVANQGRADLLSFPFIAIVAWNFAVYVYLFGSMFKRQPKPSEVQAGPIQWLHDRLHHKGWGGGKLRTEVIARFLEQWNRAASGVTALRIKQLLHICAAAWAAGLAASFLARAVTTQYWIGWESSLLNAEGLHWLLNLIFIPISILLPVQPFSLAEVQAMGYASGGGSLADHASRWVYLYTGLLAIAVIIPRLLLAVFARWRANAAARRIVVDLSDPYFRRLVDQLRPANVMLWLCTHRPEDKTAFLGAIAHKLNVGVNGLLAETGAGDTLRLADIPASPPREETVSGWKGLLGGALLGPPAGSVADEEGDLILHVVSDPADLESVTPPLHEYGKNILILANPPADAGDNGLVVQCELHSRHRDRIKGVLAFDAFGRCWPQEPALLEAIGKCLGESGAEGFSRLASTWKQRNLARFAKSMSALGYALLCAVREKEEVEAESFSVRDVFKANREARDRAREEAERRIAERLKPVYAGLLHDLLVLHGIDPTAAGTFEHAHEGGYEFRPTVNTKQAGTAGAVTGAALGMSVDAMSGGLTLGLGTLLGALLGGGLLGGGAGLMAAKWTNRKSASGAPIVQLSDEDLQKLLEGSLRLYLAVVHWGRPGSSGALDEAPAAWISETVVAIEAHKARLATVFEASRERANSADSTAALAGECDSIARQVLSSLYPETRIGPA